MLRQVPRVSVKRINKKFKEKFNKIIFTFNFQTELVTIMKRAAEGIFERGGFIRKIENLGARALPYKMSRHGLVHKHGHAVLYQFDVRVKDPAAT